MTERPSRPTTLRAVVVLVALGALASPVWPQQAQTGARLVSFTIDPPSPEFGEVFEMGLTVRFAPNLVVFIPDTLVPGPASASAGAGSWSVAEGPADSVDVIGTYPVMGFLNGRVDLPSLETWIRPATQDEEAGPRPASELGEQGPGATAALRRVLLPTGGAQIIPMREMAEAETLAPRPPADVLGGEWSGWLLAAIGLAILSAALLAWLVLGRWLLGRTTAAGPIVARSPRAEALRDLDRIMDLGLLEQGRLVEFYEASTGALRRFSEQYEPDWGIALTSTELLERLRDRWGNSSVAPLDSVVPAAEWVKFGGFRPEIDVAKAHWSALRDWIESMPKD